MNTSGWCAPFPTLGLSDDVSGDFSADASATITTDSCVVDFSGLVVTDSMVADLVFRGAASYVARVRCDATYLRASLTLSLLGPRIVLPLAAVAREVQVQLLVVSCTKLPDYRPAGVHADFGPAVFAVEPGDVLAIGPSWKLPIDPAFDLLSAPVSSLMRVVLREESGPEGGLFKARFDNERILIEFGVVGWRLYQRIRNSSASDVLHAAVVLPVLTEAICLLDGPEEVRPSGGWVLRLESLLQSRGLDDPDTPASQRAQQLLKDVFTRSATAILLKADED